MMLSLFCLGFETDVPGFQSPNTENLPIVVYLNFQFEISGKFNSIVVEPIAMLIVPLPHSKTRLIFVNDNIYIRT